MVMNKTLVQVIGFGPASLGLLVAADRNDCLMDVLDKGIVFLDRRTSNEWEGLSYQIRSNSSGVDFLSKIRVDGSFGPLANSSLAKVIHGYGGNTLPLTLVSRFMKNMAEEAEHIVSSSPASAVLYNSEVSALMLGPDGAVTSVNAQGEPLVQSAYAVIAVGATEDAHHGEGTDKDVIFNSGEIIAGKKNGELDGLIKEGRKIVIIGGSHSAFSTVIWLLKLYGEHIRPGQIEVFYKSEFQLYFKSIETAVSAGVDLNSQNVFHPTGEVNKFNGLRGVAKEIYIEIVSGRESRVKLKKTNDSKAVNGDSKNIVINAIGYSPRNIHIYDECGKRIPLLKRPRNVCLTDNCNVVTQDGKVVDKIFAMGLGHALEYNGEAKVGINFFHGEAADTILNKIFKVRGLMNAGGELLGPRFEVPGIPKSERLSSP